MKKIVGLLTCIPLVLSSNTANSHEFADVMSDVLPSVAYIQVDNYLLQNSVDPLTKESTQIKIPSRPIVGSGFVIDKNNIVTNYHVISFAVSRNTDIYVSFQGNNQKYKARILGYDKISDVALLELEDEFPSVKIDSGANLRMGDPVFTISHFYGIGWSGTHGTISSIDRRDTRYPYINNIQVQLLQGSGSSGGPVFNENGDVVGMNRSIVAMVPRSPLSLERSSMLSMVGYPIRGDTVQRAIDNIREDMIVVRVDLGVSLIDFGPDSLFHLNYKSGTDEFAYGTMVMEVDKNNTLTTLKQSDIIISVEGRKFTDPAELLIWLDKQNYKVGDTVNVQVYRDTEIINIAVELQIAGL